MITVIYGKEKIHFSDSSDNIKEVAASELRAKDQKHLSSLNFTTTTVAEFKEKLLSWWQNEHQQSNKSETKAQTIVLSSIEEIKLILQGKVVSNTDQVLTELFPASTSTVIKRDLKITMIANPLTKETIHQLEEEKIKAAELKDKLKRRKLASSKSKSSSEGRRRGPITYGFHRITTLANLPNENRAKEILEQLANDSGIIAVMNKYKFTVNELTELYPEGNVGVSDVCVMGLNQNHGQKILLRLRTDDLKGFRKFLSIKKVLYHELAHNIYSEHDNQFYILMRQIEKDANELSWEKSRGFSLLNARQRESYIRPEKHFDEDEDDEEEEKQQTVFTLGGGDNTTSAQLPANRIAGEAAILRFHQFQKQREEQRYNQYVKKPSDESSTSESDRTQAEFISERSNVEGKEQFEENKESEDSGSGSEKDHLEVDESKPMEIDNNEETLQKKITVIDYIPSDVLKEDPTPDHLSEVMVVENTNIEDQVSPSDEQIMEEVKNTEELEIKKREKLFNKKEEMNKLFEDCIIMILSDETLTSTVEKILAIKDILTTLYDQKILTINNYSNYQQFIDILQLFITILQNIQVSDL